MNKKFIFNIFLLFFCFKSNAQIILDIKAFEGLANSYSYYLIQKKQIDYIKKKHPSLNIEAQLALTRLNSNFYGSIKEIDKKINETYPKLWKKEKIKILNNINSYDFNLLRIDKAKKFLTESGFYKKIPEDVLKVFLSFNPNYIKEPFLEFSDKNTYDFEKKYENYFKFKIVLPRSWKEIESTNTKIIARFKSFAGYGSEQIRIIVEELGVDTSEYIKNNGVTDFLSEDFTSEYLSENSNFLGKGEFKSDNFNGIWIHYEAEDIIYGMTSNSEIIDYLIFHNDKIITISVYMPKDFNGVVIDKKPLIKYQKLLDSIASSLIIY